MDARNRVVTSKYSAEERAAMLEEIERVLADTDGKHAEDDGSRQVSEADDEPRWPVRAGTILPVLSTASADRSIAEAREAEAERKASRERQRAADEQRKRRAMADRMQTDRSWNEWCD